jgi:DNA-directed RNA polymerase I subunit RPA1
MGPVHSGDPPCQSCCLTFDSCPGHAGHIELAVPVHHPLLLDEILTILRCKCLACHRFRAPSRQVALWRAKFQLLLADRLEEFDQLESNVAAAIHDARGDNKTLSRRDAMKAMEQFLRGIDALASPLSPQSFASTSYHVGMYTSLRKEVITALKACKKCDHCGAFSPKLRHDSSNKIFQQARKSHVRASRDHGRLVMSSV